MVRRSHHRNTGVFIEIATSPLQCRTPISTLAGHQLRQLLACFRINNPYSTKSAVPSIALKDVINVPLFGHPLSLFFRRWYWQISSDYSMCFKNFRGWLSLIVEPFGKGMDISFYDFCTCFRYISFDHQTGSFRHQIESDVGFFRVADQRISTRFLFQVTASGLTTDSYQERRIIPYIYSPNNVLTRYATLRTLDYPC